ncbi:MAG TPA: hypothetical protein VJ343_00635 [archaeon]|nr:hypothetical protein [archaeon]
MVEIKAKCSCPKHGRLGFEEIVIKNGSPLCAKCHTVLEFCTVKPRFDVNGGTKKSKK